MMVVKTKYDYGDTVFFISNNRVMNLKVTGVGISVDDASGEPEIFYHLHYDSKMPENKLFRTKKELLESL